MDKIPESEKILLSHPIHGGSASEFLDKFPFPFKLYFVTNMEKINCIQWKSGGESILIDIVAFPRYLSRMRLIFRAKDFDIFLLHLKEYGFQTVEGNAYHGNDIILEFQHEYFKRGDIKLLAKMKPISDNVIKKPKEKLAQIKERFKNDNNYSKYLENLISLNRYERRKDDPCLRVCGTMSELQIKRHVFCITEKFKSVKKLDVIPPSMVVTPFKDQLKYFMPEENKEFPGFHGDATVEQLRAFYGETRPIFDKPNTPQ